jgi:hypothetical protein
VSKSKEDIAHEVAEKISAMWMAFGKEQLQEYMQQHGEQQGIRPHYCAGWRAGVQTVAMLQAIKKLADTESASGSGEQ